MKRKVPKLKTDAEAERFLARDLSDLDFSQFKPANFEFEKKSARVNMRLPETSKGREGTRNSAQNPLSTLHSRVA